MYAVDLPDGDCRVSTISMQSQTGDHDRSSTASRCRSTETSIMKAETAKPPIIQQAPLRAGLKRQTMQSRKAAIANGAKWSARNWPIQHNAIKAMHPIHSTATNLFIM